MKTLILLLFYFPFWDLKGQNIDEFINNVMKMEDAVVIYKPYYDSCKMLEIYNNANEGAVMTYVIIPPDVLKNIAKMSVLREKAIKQSCFINPRSKAIQINGFVLTPFCGITNDKISNLLIDNFEKIYLQAGGVVLVTSVFTTEKKKK